MKTETTSDKRFIHNTSKLEGVDFDSLGININSLIKNRFSNNAKTLILKPSGKAKCNDCRHLFEIKNHLSNCPKCFSFNTIIISGKELRVRAYLFE